MRNETRANAQPFLTANRRCCFGSLSTLACGAKRDRQTKQMLRSAARRVNLQIVLVLRMKNQKKKGWVKNDDDDARSPHQLTMIDSFLDCARRQQSIDCDLERARRVKHARCIFSRHSPNRFRLSNSPRALSGLSAGAESILSRSFSFSRSLVFFVQLAHRWPDSNRGQRSRRCEGQRDSQRRV